MRAKECNDELGGLTPAPVGLIDLSTTNLTPAASSIIRASRMDKFFHLLYPVDNMTSSFTGLLDITGVINPAGHSDPDVVTREVRSVFKAQTPEKRIYDDDGNLLKDGHWTYTWNAENRLVNMEEMGRPGSPQPSARRLEFAYDYQGRRYAKKVFRQLETGSWELETKTKFLWSGNQIIQDVSTDLTSSKTATNSYVWGLDLSQTLQGAGGVGGLLSVSKCSVGSVSQYFPCCDANGNVTDYVTTNGTIAAHYEYDAYGNITAATGSLGDDFAFRFSTKFFDSETGLYYYGFRYYNPGMGRWINRDPIEELGGLNLYGFVANNPINETDFLGESVKSKGLCVLACYVGMKTYEVKGLFNWNALSRTQRKLIERETLDSLNKLSSRQVRSLATKELGVVTTGTLSRSAKWELARKLAKARFSKRATRFLFKKMGKKVSAKAAVALAPNVVPVYGQITSAAVTAVFAAGDVWTVCKCSVMCSKGTWE